MRISAAVLFSLALGCLAWVLVNDPIHDEDEAEGDALIPEGRLVAPGHPDMDVRAVLAAGKAPSGFTSEYEADIHAQRYEIARRAANDASVNHGADFAALSRLRAALLAWDMAVHDAAYFQARGGTMYVHLSARSGAETEDFLATILLAIDGDRLPGTGAGSRSAATETTLRRIAALELVDFGVEDSAEAIEERRQELARHRAKLSAAWIELENCLPCLLPPAAARTRARALELLDLIMS